MNRFLMLLLLMGASFLTYGQSSDIKKPEYVIIAGNEIITKEQATNLGKEGYVKAMQKGVTSEERAALVEKFGEKIGDKEFIVLLTIFTEEERQANQKKKNVTAPKNDVTSYDHEYLLKINDLAVDFTVKMLDGKKVKLSSLKGKVVLINFWATWCAPCIMEFYDFPEKIIRPFKDRAFMLLPISKGEPRDKVAEKMAKLKKDGLNFPVGIDPDGAIWDRYATGSIPKSFLIDKNGKIRYISTGNGDHNLEQLALVIKKLVEEK